MSHSTVVDQCQVIIDSMTLEVLTRVIQAYPDNHRILSIIGKIISNISLHPEFHKAIFQSGWVGLLAAWKQDENLLISLPATKAPVTWTRSTAGTSTSLVSTSCCPMTDMSNTRTTSVTGGWTWSSSMD